VVYLKKEERIAILLMVIALMLLVYTINEWKIRMELAMLGEIISNQKGEPTQRPETYNKVGIPVFQKYK